MIITKENQTIIKYSPIIIVINHLDTFGKKKKKNCLDYTSISCLILTIG